MTGITKDNDTYTLTGLSMEDLEVIQEGLHRLFTESHKDEHRNFRSQVLKIDRAIDPVLGKHYSTNTINL